MENSSLRHVAIIQDEDEAAALKKLNDAVDQYRIKIINYNKERIRTDECIDPIWRIEIFFEADSNPFNYDFSGSHAAAPNSGDANHTRSR